MALIRWEPFPEIDTLQREMNSLFDSLSPTPTTKANKEVAFIPPAEIPRNSRSDSAKTGNSWN
jgi:HSP20 family protein